MTNRTLLVLAVLMVVSPTGSRGDLISYENGTEAALAVSPTDFVAGVVEIVKRCEWSTDTSCVDRVRIVNLVASRSPSAKHSEGETILLLAGPRSRRKEPTSRLIVAVPRTRPPDPVIYSTKLQQEEPTRENIQEFISVVGDVIRRHGV